MASDRPSVPFWYLLRAAQISVFIQVLLGALLVVTGHEAADGLHYLYGFLPLPVSLLAEAARAGAAHHESGRLEFKSLPRAASGRWRWRSSAARWADDGQLHGDLLLALRAAGTSLPL